ncbi:18840_t:CDS:2, partial [Funneliformis geosporum]
MVKTQTTKNLANDYSNENQDIESDILIQEQVISAVGRDCGCGFGREKTGTEGNKKTIMKPITTPMTSQIDSHETNEVESSEKEEIIMEMSTIVTSSNKCHEKES